MTKNTQSKESRLLYAQMLAERFARNSAIDCEKYFNDPQGFIEEGLGETLTPDLIEACNSVRDYTVTILQSGNGTGKSWFEARIALWFFCCRTEPQVYCAAAPPQTNLENILWAELSTVCNKKPSLVHDCTIKSLKITRKPLEFVTGVSIPASGDDATKQARFSGKHAKSLFFEVDEGDAVPDPVYAGIETCMSGEYDRLLITFNPRKRQGYVYRTIRAGHANIIKLSAFAHPNVITGENVIPGAVTREKTARRISQWTRPIAKGEARDKRCFELPEFMVGTVPVDQKGNRLPPLVPGWYKIIEHQFSHVVLGEYPAQADNQLISEEWIDKARSRYDLFTAKHGVITPENINCTTGLDVAEFGNDSSVECDRFGNFVHPLSTLQKSDPIEVGDWTKRNLDRKGIKMISAVYVDGTGVGSGVAPYLVKTYFLPAVSVKVAQSSKEKTDLGDFGNLNDELMWKLREWLRTDLAMLPNDPELTEELLAFNYDIINGKVKVSSTDQVKELLKRSPDRARALMFSFAKQGLFADSDLS